jgi:hypothetical protein
VVGYKDGKALFSDNDKGPLATLGRSLEDLINAPNYDPGTWGQLYDYVLSSMVETNVGDFITRERVCVLHAPSSKERCAQRCRC